MFRRMFAWGGMLLLAGAVLFGTPGPGQAQAFRFGGYRGGFYRGYYRPSYGFYRSYRPYYGYNPYYGYGYNPYAGWGWGPIRCFPRITRPPWRPIPTAPPWFPPRPTAASPRPPW